MEYLVFIHEWHTLLSMKIISKNIVVSNLKIFEGNFAKLINVSGIVLNYQSSTEIDA